MNVALETNVSIDRYHSHVPILVDLLTEEIIVLEEKIFSMQICDDPTELIGVEAIIQQFKAKNELLKVLTCQNAK